eukprot:TCONS_00017634-protein
MLNLVVQRCSLIILLGSFVDSTLLCECRKATNQTSIPYNFNCQELNGCYATGLKNRCFATKTEKGCISWKVCLHYEDLGYALNKTILKCCKDKQYCNSDIVQSDLDLYIKGEEITDHFDVNFKIDESSKTKNTELSTEEVIIIVVFAPCLAILLLSILWLGLRFIKKYYQKKLDQEALDSINRQAALESLISNGGGSGSGVGVAHLNQRTLSWQIILQGIVGSGGFGTVQVGYWNGQKVAVKIIDSNEQESWEQEKDLYLTKLLNHENILGFIGADVKEDAYEIQRWLVFDYHPNGSVYDFLQTNTLNIPQMLMMVSGVLDGLYHLHLELKTSNISKPAIAHRDMKTKNILVKLDGTCCLADFGLAHKRLPNQNSTGDVPPQKVYVGTSRYQAPELLANKIDGNRFEQFKMTDIYSLALCLWEFCWRTCVDDEIPVHEYELPYKDDVPSNPSATDMKPVVCTEGRRPPIPPHWENDETMKKLSKMIGYCWLANPDERLRISRVRKQVHTLKDECKLTIKEDGEIEKDIVSVCLPSLVSNKNEKSEKSGS